MTEDSLDQVLAPFRANGGQHYGEDVTQYAHAVQCAALAAAAGAPAALVAAALLHDVGQLQGDAGAAAERDGIDARHEETGAAWLATWFGPAVTEPVRLHVAAKRYLCATDADYTRTLSPASRLSLALQGGVMDAAEAAAFRAHTHFAAAVALRCWDDAAKRRDVVVPPLASWRPLLTGLLRQP
ncbi:MAG: phosphohydrolase [Sphingomonadales bacterium]|jgi:phosphonate degradation associated HDIG domain protein